jgi:hypothetical protein
MERGQHINHEDRTCRCISSSLVDDEYHKQFVCPGAACVRQDFSEVVQQCSLGSPELSLKALMAYPDVKLVAFFVYCCLRRQDHLNRVSRHDIFGLDLRYEFSPYGLTRQRSACMNASTCLSVESMQCNNTFKQA